MTKIEELLKNEKVEWKKLGEVLDYEQPTKYIVESTNYDDSYMTPVLTAGQSFILGYTDEKNGIYEADKENPVIIFDDFTSSFKWVDFNFKVKSSAMKILTVKEDKDIAVDLRYCYHYMGIIKINTIEHNRLWISKYSQIEIPIPSPEIQEKIVSILDDLQNNVTELKITLKEELEARNSQYHYYRDMLLSEEYLKKVSEKLYIEDMDKNTRITTLGEVGIFARGNGLQKSDFRETGKPVIHYGQIHSKFGFATDKVISFVEESVFNKLKKAKKNDILIATTSENIEDVCKSVVWMGEEEIGFSGDMHSYSTLENSKYIAYYFQTEEFRKQKIKKVTGTKIMRINMEDLSKITISLPALTVQNKVVEILDKFQSILSETTGLLPQEIKQRQKQYEFYREKLLTFETKCDNTHTHDSI